MSSGSFLRRPAVLLAFALVSVGGLVTLLGRLATGPHVEQKRVPLTSEAGAKSYPAFSPDGQRIAYSARAAGKMDTFHLYVRTVAPDTPRQLTTGSGNDVGPAWSPDGNSLAFLRMDNGHAQYVVVPMGGGAERKVAEFSAAGDEGQLSPSVAWMNDGKSLVVVQAGDSQLPGLALVEIATGKVTRITNPAAGTEGDSCPAVSPDGAALAFVRSTGADGADIYLSDPAGANPPRRLTFDDHGIRGIAWTPDSRDLLYASNRVGGWRVWRVPAYGGSPRELPIAGQRAQYPAVSAAGNHMAFTDSPSVSAIWRATLGSSETATEDRPLIRTSGNESSAMYSPDGTKIADISDQTGADEIWVSDAEGGNRVRVTNFNGPPMNRLRWSPDGKAILFDERGDRGQDLYSVPAVAGAKPTRLLLQSWNGSWSQDGKRIYYDSRGQLWKATMDGGNPEVLVSEFGAVQGVESVDGKYVFYRLRRSFWRVPVTGGEGEEVIVPDYDLPFGTTIQPAKKGVYYSEVQRSTRSQLVSFYDFATKKSSNVFQIKTGNFGFNQGHVFSVSPDGKYVVYPRVDQSQTDLILVENFR
jgi:Tol biopolymer transport system component